MVFPSFVSIALFILFTVKRLEVSTVVIRLAFIKADNDSLEHAVFFSKVIYFSLVLSTQVI